MGEQTAAPVVVTAPPVAKIATATNPPPAPKAIEPPKAEPAKPIEPATPDPALLREQFLKLTREAKQNLAEKQKIADDRRALETERAKYAAEMEEARQLKAWKENARKDPDAINRALYGEDWFRTMYEFALEKRPPPDLRVDALREEVEKLKSETAAKEAKALEDAKQREVAEQTALVERFNAQAINHVKAAGEKYELINTLGYHDHVPELVREHYSRQSNLPPEERKLLSVDEAAQMVEEWIEAQAEKAFSSKRLTSKRASAQTPQQEQALDGKKPEAKTLDNTLTGGVAQPAAARSEAERVKRAFAAFDAAKAKKNGV